VTAITVIATITLILDALPQRPVSRRARILRNATFVVPIGCAVVIALDRSYTQNYVARNERKVIAEIALRQGIEGRQSTQDCNAIATAIRTRASRASRRTVCAVPLALSLREAARSIDP
jgi:hypothetical protein